MPGGGTALRAAQGKAHKTRLRRPAKAGRRHAAQCGLI